jgi:hypothetical protein
MQTAWWKATGIEGEMLHLVDRHGHTARMRRTARYQHCRAIKWQPGDDRNDEE